ncbi:MAG TPA: bifunctional YncE family protein/alkaline phosphatase family protein [Armatimonadota bacterium]|nr:bifunctional YncE family protein/alkaline phosphatase family protein [Armatimonadota bacterium]
MRSGKLFLRALLPAALATALLPVGNAPIAAKPVETVGGPHKDGSYLVPTRQVIHPAGDVVTYPGRPVDLAMTPDGRFLYAKDNRGVVAVDAKQWKVIQQLKEGGASLHGILVAPDGRRLYATDAGAKLREWEIADDGTLRLQRAISLDPRAYGCGLALSSDGTRLYVCQNRLNNLAVLDREKGEILQRIPTGIAPYAVRLSPDGHTAYVSNWGGRFARPGEETAPSAGTPVPVDDRGVAVSGSVSFLDLDQGKETAQIETGRHAADMALTDNGRLLYVANANDDTVSVVDTDAGKLRASILVRPEPDIPYGSASNALALSADERTLYVANGGNNAVAVVDVSGMVTASQQAKEENWSGWLVYGLKKGESAVRGFIPSGWYPGAITRNGETLFVANVKGYGSRDGDGRRVQNALGSFCRIPLPNQTALRRYTKQALNQSLVPRVLAAYQPARPGVRPTPVPERVGEPSVFKHVVFVIKENRTYDQVFGDMPQGNGDPSLVHFGREVTPNHHKIAENFVLLDNYYCNGVVSADGHSWCTEGNSTDHLEKAFGGFARSYTFGDDPLTYSSSGFIWDNVLARGLTFRNFGEFDNASVTPKGSWQEIYSDFTDNGKLDRFSFIQKIGVRRVREQTDPAFPGWNLGIPDVVRADVFLRDLKAHDADPSSEWYNFIIVYLPDDHTGGPPTPRAQVADNDLSLGRVLEGISKSRFWPETVLFCMEDDPQAGLDHVDGHRSLCLVASPYTRRGVVVHEFYTQTAVLHTIEQILGCKPMNQMDALSPLMTACFTNKPDFTPYAIAPNNIPLDEMPKKTALNGYARKLTQRVARIDLSQPGRKTSADDDALNRYLWHTVKGWKTPYPAQFAGYHGRGLKALGLVLDENAREEEDE